MSTSISEAVEILKQKAREDAKLFFEEFGEELDPASTDWDSVAFQTSFNELAFDTKDALEQCSDRGWEVYQSELVAETKRLAGLE